MISDDVARQFPAGFLAENDARNQYRPPADPVVPEYYQGTINGKEVEVFDVLEAFGLDEDAYLSQAVQYILRHEKKHGVEDLEKAVCMIQRRIAKLKGQTK